MSGANLSNVTKCLFGEYLSKDGMMISDWGGKSGSTSNPEK